MIKLTPAGVNTATSYPLTVEITEKLCKEYCVNTSPTPIVTKSYSITDTQVVNGTMFATIQCLVNVAYRPIKGCKCSLVNNTFVETFNVSFAGATTASTIDFTPADGFTEPYYTNNQCSKANGVRDVSTLNIVFTAS